MSIYFYLVFFHKYYCSATYFISRMLPNTSLKVACEAYTWGRMFFEGNFDNRERERLFVISRTPGAGGKPPR